MPVFAAARTAGRAVASEEEGRSSHELKSWHRLQLAQMQLLLPSGGSSSLCAMLELLCHCIPFGKLSPSNHPEPAQWHSRTQGFQAD